MKKIIAGTAALFILCGCACAGERNIHGVTQEMLAPDYWISRAAGAGAEIMPRGAIEELNGAIAAAPKCGCTDVLSFPETMSKDAVLKLMAPYLRAPSEKFFVGSAPVSKDFIAQLRLDETAAAVPDLVAVRFSVIVKNSPLWNLPYDGPLYESPEDRLFPVNLETTLKIWEPAAIMHDSADGAWSFVVTKSAYGWIKREAAAEAPPDRLRLIEALPFYTVTGNRITTDLRADRPGEGRTELFMGTRLPADDGAGELTITAAPSPGGTGIELSLAPRRADHIDEVITDFSRAVLLPERAPDGTLSLRRERIPLCADIVKGTLPFTAENIIRQAYKMLGERYGWGGLLSARDCSAFIRDIYLSMGIELPRNSGAQARIPAAHTDLSKLSTEKRLRALKAARPGALLRMPGHIMLYLGEAGGRPYIIHDAYAYGASGARGEGGRTTVNCVAISDLAVTRKNGNTFLYSLTDLTEIK